MRGKEFSVGLLIGCLVFLAKSAQAFALMGQYESWMRPSNDFRLPSDWLYGGQGNVGGPMWISNGFRWNVPVITYGFDQSFLNFFGSNGVAAVEGAIQILNDLPPASETELTNYPFYSRASNPEAVAENLLDLQSVTLSLLLEEMGLAPPTRYVYVLRQWTPILEQEGNSELWHETLLPGVSGVGAYANAFKNGASRPGVNKVTFIRHPMNSSLTGFLPLTNRFSDVFVTNSGFAQQELRRVITQPDILFSVADLGQSEPLLYNDLISGTSNWFNNASLNGRPCGVGPGVIKPPINITFNTMGLLSIFDGNTIYNVNTPWGTYAQSTNALIVYPPPQFPTNQLTVRFWFKQSYGLFPTGQAAVSSITARTGTVVLIQTSTNLTDWISISTNQVNGSVWTFRDVIETNSARFFRVVPQ